VLDRDGPSAMDKGQNCACWSAAWSRYTSTPAILGVVHSCNKANHKDRAADTGRCTVCATKRCHTLISMEKKADDCVQHLSQTEVAMRAAQVSKPAQSSCLIEAKAPCQISPLIAQLGKCEARWPSSLTHSTHPTAVHCRVWLLCPSRSSVGRKMAAPPTPPGSKPAAAKC
jgi:hypothetical protein